MLSEREKRKENMKPQTKKKIKFQRNKKQTRKTKKKKRALKNSYINELVKKQSFYFLHFYSFSEKKNIFFFKI